MILYKTRSKFFQSFGFPHRLKNKKFKFTSPVSPNKNIKTKNSLTGSGKRKGKRTKLWSDQFKTPKPKWFNELDKQFRQYKFLKNKWMQRQETKDDQIPGDSFEKDLRDFDFRSLKKLCDKYIDLLDIEFRIATTYRIEFEIDKKRKKIRYELYQINQLMHPEGRP